MKKTCTMLIFALVWLVAYIQPSMARSVDDLSQDQSTLAVDGAVQTSFFDAVTMETDGPPIPLVQVAMNPTIPSEPQRVNPEAQAEVHKGPLVLAGKEGAQEPAPQESEDTIADPFEPLNRAFFHFNDKLYFWLLKPVATGYKAVVPEPARVGVRNFFYNLAFPIRFVNSLLQGKVEGAVNEFARFIANSTFGLAGFLDVIPKDAEMKRSEEDLGQTFGSWGLGPGFFINWPILGPSSARDTLGTIGDVFVSPTTYLISHTEYNVATRSFDVVNETSLTIGDYESFKKAALDPYIALRNAYHEHRQSKIKE